MWHRINLRWRIMILVGLLTCLTVGGGLLSLLYSYQTNNFFKAVVDEDLSALKAADRLEITLVMQKGYLTYFQQDSESHWLKELNRYHDEFLKWLAEARDQAGTMQEKRILDQIDTEFSQLSSLRSLVIEKYQAGLREEGYQIHQRARKEFFQILDLASDYRNIHEERLNQARNEISQRARALSQLSMIASPIALILSLLLVFILIRNVLAPIRKMAVQTGHPDRLSHPTDDVQVLRNGVLNLLQDVDHARSALETSRTQLEQSAKMAAVGKLAASVAHSVRNPLTSVKMRLFSLEHSQDFRDAQQEDFAVISEEIEHIDHILRNFLEFSRRPKLDFKRINPSQVVAAAVDLVRPRFNASRIELELLPGEEIPEIDIDPDQLKEALVNLLVNASESVEHDGKITVETGRLDDKGQKRSVFIRISDSGPGVPEAIQQDIFQPFFSTKADGTGLGLSIAQRIVDEHEGWIEVASGILGGACFSIVIPMKESAH